MLPIELSRLFSTSRVPSVVGIAVRVSLVIFFLCRNCWGCSHRLRPEASCRWVDQVKHVTKVLSETVEGAAKILSEAAAITKSATEIAKKVSQAHVESQK